MNESQTHPSLENGRRVERFAHIGHALNQTQIARPEFRKIPKLPPIQRTSMAPRALQRRVWPRILRALSGRRSRLQTRPAAWRIQAAQRRVGLAMLVVCQTALATWSLTRTFPSADLTFLQLAILAVFAVLFSWISFSFWSNVAGFAALWGKTKIADASTLRAGAGKALCGRTAVLMPICEEDARRCFRAIEAMCRSLHRTGESDKFDFFVLSDTSTAKRRFEEESEWLRTCRALRGLGRIYYRRRRVNIKRKSGNVADFLRRWSPHSE